MRKVLVSFLLLFFTLVPANAGDNLPVVKDDANYKALGLSVEYKKSEKDADKFLVTVKVRGNGIGEIYLFSQNKNFELKPTLSKDVATINFEVDKKSLDDSRFYFSYPNKSKCPPSFALELKNYIN